MKKKEKVIITSGEFDFLDYNVIKFLNTCRSKGDWLIVGVHTDMFMELCRSGYKNDYEKRVEMVMSVKSVDETFRFDDGDGTVCNLLKLVKHCYPMAEMTYISDIDMSKMPETRIRGISFETMKQE